MPINLLRIQDFRNLSAVELLPSIDGLNLIYGNNGSGKTSLLEAIYFLGLGKSFRASSAFRLIRQTASKFSIFAQLEGGELSIPVGVQKDQCGTRLRMAEKDVSSVAELAYFLPIRMLNSQSHHIFESGPLFRRKYLDWGLFYESEAFLLCWRQYERILKQRNIVLRDKRPKQELTVWTDKLIQYGLELDKFRQDYVAALTPLIQKVVQELLFISEMNISYYQGWDEASDFANVLMNDQEEYRLGHTQFGPHRADLHCSIEGIAVKHFLSRGQQKLLICAMLIAQGIRLMDSANKKLIYLIDDLPSELDLQSRERLLLLLTKQPTQIFVTSIEKNILCDVVSNKTSASMKVFHVEQGFLKRAD